MKIKLKQKEKGLRCLLVLLAMTLLLCLCLSACGDDENTDGGSSNDGDNSQVTDYAEMAGVDPNWSYEGQTFTFYIGSDGWTSDDIWDDENSTIMGSSSGEPLYDAVMQRVLLMDELYGCTIAVMDFDNDSPYQSITNHLNAGDNSFQAISTSGEISYRLAVEGMLWDFTQWDNIDTTAEWWDQNFVDQMTLNGHLYFLNGEYSRLDNQMTHAIAFNKDMCGQYEGLPEAEEFYQMVKDGEWTLDRMFEYASLVTGEVDGDGQLTDKDRIGLLYRQTSIFGFLQGSGVYIAQKDSNGDLQFSFWSDKTATLWEKLIDMANSPYAMNTDKDGSGSDGKINASAMMDEDRALLFCEYIDTFEKMRQSEINFGILPFPKYDENQENYISASHDYGTNFLTVPIMNMDTENTGNILNIFSVMGQELITPVYYDNVLYSKTVRDVESRDMLDIIYDTKYYDLGTYMNWSNFAENLMEDMWNEKSPNISSFYSSNSRRIERQIEQEMSSDAFASVLG